MTAYEAVLIRGLDEWPPLPPLRTEREFRWYHLAVLAASAFVLGVIVWGSAVGA